MTVFTMTVYSGEIILVVGATVIRLVITFEVVFTVAQRLE